MARRTGKGTRHLQTTAFDIGKVAAAQDTDERRGSQMEFVTITKRSTACAILLALAVLGLGLDSPRAEAAVEKRCGSVVKGIDFGEMVFYEAKVLIVRGADSVTCSEARLLAFRGMDMDGICAFGGCVRRGWTCTPKREIPQSVKCVKEDPRRVVKSTRPRHCPKCHANRR